MTIITCHVKTKLPGMLIFFKINVLWCSMHGTFFNQFMFQKGQRKHTTHYLLTGVLIPRVLSWTTYSVYYHGSLNKSNKT